MSAEMTMKNSAMISHEKVSAPRWGGGAKGVAVCGLVGLLATGCDVLMQKPHCPELSSCGGAVPVGSWTLAPGHGSCTEDIYVPPTDTRLPGGVVPAARTNPPEPALYDWCDQLVTQAYNPGSGIVVTAPNYYTPDIQLGVAVISYTAATGTMPASYTAGLGRTGTFSLTFPALCMREFGASGNNPTVSNGSPVGGAVDLCKQLEGPLQMMAKNTGAYPDTNCGPDPDVNDQNGCVCTFTANEEGGGAGTYIQVDDHTLLNLPGKDFPQKVTYCNTGSELQLTGADGEYLFGTVGLRTLDLVPMK